MNLKKFSEMELSKSTQRVLKERGFVSATPVQSLVIPKLMSGKSVAVQSKTGTGKTLAYAIPIVEKLKPVRRVQALILCPTRELAIQVSEQFNFLLKYRHQRAITLYGGQKIGIQFKALKKGGKVVVGTPGRVIDHLKRGTLNLKNVETFVLDEADEMLDMGFLDDVRKILERTSPRQGILLSATMSKEVVKLGKKLQEGMEFLRISRDELTPPSVRQYYFKVREGEKFDLIFSFLSLKDPTSAMVFCNTKKKVDEVASFLKSKGVRADSIHGDLRQHTREKVMRNFRMGRTKVLVATDVAARGIDIGGVEMVVNFDLPGAKSYVHRVGRTARMGKKGYAYAFVTPREGKNFSMLKKYVRTEIGKAEFPH